MITASLRRVGRLLLVCFLTAVVAALGVIWIAPKAVDGAALTVLTGSMEPTIPAGSTIVVRPVDPATLATGDVITFQKAPGEAVYITHRITAVDPTTSPISFRTKGDANAGEDLEPVPATAVRGEVWFDVPHLGAVRNALSAGPVALVLAVIGLVGYALTQVASAVRDARGETPSPVPSGREAQLLIASVWRTDLARLLAMALEHGVRAQELHDDDGHVTVAVVGSPPALDALATALEQLADVHFVRSNAVAPPRLDPVPPARQVEPDRPEQQAQSSMSTLPPADEVHVDVPVRPDGSPEATGPDNESAPSEERAHVPL